jgi:hypothetical protein
MILPYEKKYYSQHGEDGIIEFLLGFLNFSILDKKTFLEIGWGNGAVNCCRNLIENHNFKGTGVDLRKSKFKNKNFVSVIKFLTVDDIDFLLSLEGSEPTMFSLDIDSIDWHILNGMLSKNFQPKIICHEYNSTLGPSELWVRSNKEGTIYDKKFRYGASLSAYKKILNPLYNFITVDSSGVNAFWLRKDIVVPYEFQKNEFLFLKNYGENHQEKLVEILNVDDRWIQL